MMTIMTMQTVSESQICSAVTPSLPWLIDRILGRIKQGVQKHVCCYVEVTPSGWSVAAEFWGSPKDSRSCCQWNFVLPSLISKSSSSSSPSVQASACFTTPCIRWCVPASCTMVVYLFYLMQKMAQVGRWFACNWCGDVCRAPGLCCSGGWRRRWQWECHPFVQARP